MTDEDPDADDDEPAVSTTPGGKRGPGKTELASEFLPGETVEKTILDLEDPHRVAVLRQLDQLYPEVAELQSVIDPFLDEFLQAKPSIGGQSRQEAVEVLKAMHGVDNDENNTGAQLAAALGADVED